MTLLFTNQFYSTILYLSHFPTKMIPEPPMSLQFKELYSTVFNAPKCKLNVFSISIFKQLKFLVYSLPSTTSFIPQLQSFDEPIQRNQSILEENLILPSKTHQPKFNNKQLSINCDLNVVRMETHKLSQIFCKFLQINWFHCNKKHITVVCRYSVEQFLIQNHHQYLLQKGFT